MRTPSNIRKFTIFVLYLPYGIGVGFLALTLPIVLARGGIPVGIVEVG